MFSCVGIGNRESSFGFGELSSLELNIVLLGYDIETHGRDKISITVGDHVGDLLWTGVVFG